MKKKSFKLELLLYSSNFVFTIKEDMLYNKLRKMHFDSNL